MSRPSPKKGKVTDELLDEYAAMLADRLDAILASLPKNHPDHFAAEGSLPDREKKAIRAKDRPPYLEL